jgi:hypothetical protein
MSEPSKPPSGAPSEPQASRRRGNPGNLSPGIKPGQERGPDGKLIPKPPREPDLSSDATTTLLAMQQVVSQPPSADRTWQHQNLRKWMLDAPAAFHARLVALEEAEAGKPPAGAPTAAAAPPWDGKSQCPTCQREPIPDDGPLDEILLMPFLRACMDHKSHVEPWLRERGWMA